VACPFSRQQRGSPGPPIGDEDYRFSQRGILTSSFHPRLPTFRVAITPEAQRCARGAWPAIVHSAHAGSGHQALIRAFGIDGMLVEGDADFRSGEEVDVEVNLGDRPVTIAAEVLRGPGAAFLRFSDRAQNRDAVLRAVGCLPPRPPRVAARARDHESATHMIGRWLLARLMA
jgi:hypothetical protein